MKKLGLTLALVAGIAMLPALANASPINVEIAYSINGGGLTVIGSGTGTANVSGTFASWAIQGSTAVTNSPLTSPSGLYFNELTAACAANCGTLHLFASSTGFTDAAQLGEGFTFNSAAESPASASQLAFWDGGNAFFGTTGSFGSALTLTGSPASGASLLGPTPSGTYSLTIEESFVPVSNYTYNTTGSISAAVPEPATLALLGTGLLGLGLVFKRRLTGGDELA